MTNELYSPDLERGLKEFRRAVQEYLKDRKISSKTDPTDIDEQEMIDEISKIIDSEQVYTLRGFIPELERTAGSALAKYVTDRKEGQPGGRLKQLIDTYQEVTGKTVKEILWTAKLRVRPKKQKRILVADWGDIGSFCSEAELKSKVVNHPEKYFPWSEMTKEQREDPLGKMQILSIANVANFYTTKGFEAALRYESRVKTSEGLIRKLMKYIWQQQQPDQKPPYLPKDIIGGRTIVVNPKQMYKFVHKLSDVKKDIKIVRYVTYDSKGGLDPRKYDRKTVDRLVGDAEKLDDKYRNKIGTPGFDIENVPARERNSMIIGLWPAVHMDNIILREIIQDPRMARIYNDGSVVGHDTVYALCRDEREERESLIERAPKAAQYVRTKLENLFSIEHPPEE